MIRFSEYYHIAAEEIEMIQTVEGSDANFPFGLKVTLRSGQTASVAYPTKKERNADWQDMLDQISRERRQDYEQIYNKLWLLEAGVRRIDKRQLRIWRILSRLLKVKAEDVEGS